MNGKAMLRLDFVVYNCHFKLLILESGMGRDVELSSPLHTPRLSEFGVIPMYHRSLTVPMSHYKYNER
eukprot:scaffold181061_cov83-Cyclotella_meneghiniana.AAC.1